MKSMRRTILATVSILGLLLGACDSGNPVAPPAPPNGGGSGSDAVTVAVTSDRGQLEAGSVQGATLTISARKADGTPAPDGTEVVLNTNMGSFGADAAGQPVQLVKKNLAGGGVTVQFFPGADAGTANILAQVGTSVGRLNLPIAGASAPPVAEFTFEISGLSVLFADASTGSPVAWEWDFGDGESTTRQNPMHTYPAATTYTVSLKVRSASGAESTKRKFITVEAGLPLTAAFAFEADGLTVLFTDVSAGEPVSWIWDFGDGGASSERNPSHTYKRAGSFTVKLTVMNEFGVTSTASKFVNPSLGEPPQAEFQFQADGLRVLFTDASANKPTRWSWDFGDGTSSTAQNPEHVFAQPGTYNVTLTAMNDAGSTAKSKFVTVSRGEPPEADFEFQVNGLNVVFIDRSQNKPTSWTWEFGDCSGPLCQSTEQNPTHTYAQPGSYTVILTAGNAAGTSRATKLVTVGTTDPPLANFCYQRNGLVVIFTDESLQEPKSWQWDFGDCAEQAATCKSSSQNPGHTYLLPKTYAVTLTVANAAGQHSRSKFIVVDENAVDAGPVCF